MLVALDVLLKHYALSSVPSTFIVIDKFKIVMAMAMQRLYFHEPLRVDVIEVIL